MIHDTEPPAFPPAGATPDLPEPLRTQGVGLRNAALSDLPFLRSLFAGFRAAEMAPVPWPQAQKDAFLADQFRLQHLHFVTHFPDSDFWLIDQSRAPASARPIGRLYLDRSGPLWRVIDIGFIAEKQGGGLGRALLEWVQRSAVSAGAKGVDLHVAFDNPRARALYERLGFSADGPPEGYHQHMVWRSSAV